MLTHLCNLDFSDAAFSPLIRKVPKADNKITFAKFRKTFNMNCIMLRNQSLEGNTVDPDETTDYELSHLILQCLHIQLSHKHKHNNC